MERQSAWEPNSPAIPSFWLLIFDQTLPSFVSREQMGITYIHISKTENTQNTHPLILLFIISSFSLFAPPLYNSLPLPTKKQKCRRSRSSYGFLLSCWGYSSAAAPKGFGISSLPSAGLMRTRSVPRTTTRPSDRVVSLPWSSRRVSCTSSRTRFMRAS